MVSIDSLLSRRLAVLVLENGMIFRGIGFGATKRVFGECIFTANAGAGYDELLTDPNSYKKIICFTYPLIGNVGFASWEKDQEGLTKRFESDSLKTAGLVIHELTEFPSHYECVKTLEDTLQEAGIPGIQGVDTRFLTQTIVKEGSQRAMLEVFDAKATVPSDDELRSLLSGMEAPSVQKVLPEVSRKQPETFTPPNPIATVVAIDCGIKNSIIRNLTKRGLKVVVLPYNSSYEQVMSYSPKGVLISNGPGNPALNNEPIELCKQLISKKVPTMGICLGNILLGVAAGAKCVKMKSGHHGSSRPVVDLTAKRAYITGQFHDYAIDSESLKDTGFKLFFENLDDRSCEGIFHENLPIFGVQFPPGPFPAPEDTNFLYDRFLTNMGLKN